MTPQKMMFVLYMLLFLGVNAAFSQDTPIETQPNYVRTTVLAVGKDTEGNLKDLVTTVYSDGLGRQIQSKTFIDNNREQVTSTFYDEIGRVQYVTKPFVDASRPGYFLDANLSELIEIGDGPLWNQYWYRENRV